MDKKLYSRSEALEITGEKNQRIQYLALKGVFTPADKGSGKGTARKYSKSNLLEILLVQSLAPIVNNVDFIKSILDEIRKTKPSYFAVRGHAEDSLEKGGCILTVLVESKNAIMVYVTGLEKANEITNSYLPKGLIAVQIDLNFLKTKIVKKIKGGDKLKHT